MSPGRTRGNIPAPWRHGVDPTSVDFGAADLRSHVCFFPGLVKLVTEDVEDVTGGTSTEITLVANDRLRNSRSQLSQLSQLRHL